jgi:thiamine-phosphate diphosphorylase/hydroxyethylthiazole kinase
MHAPKPDLSNLPDISAELLTRVRARNPRVHCITNAVAQNFTANVLLAMGAVPSMTVAADEIGEFVARADALLINLGTFDRERRNAAEIAIQTAIDERRPWLLDPVFVDRSQQRAAFAKMLAGRRPRAVRLNEAEFTALADVQPSHPVLKRYACDKHTVIALTGAIDVVTDGTRIAEIENGDPLMGRVTAMGCGRGAGVRRAGGGARCVACHRRGALGLRRRRRVRGGARTRAGQLRDGVHRRARVSRSRDAAAAGTREVRRPPMRIDLRLYALLDPDRAGGHDLAELAHLVALGGASLVQLRDKRSETRRMVERARAIKAELVPFGIPLLINDRIDVALAADADGVHVGQDDMTVEDARRLLGRDALIGLSIKTAAQADAAPLELLDYAGIGGVFATASKDNPDPPIGTDGLARIAARIRRRAAKFPLCAIAGIDAGNASAAIAAGADGVAVISALSLAGDPQAATRVLRGAVDQALAQRARQ